MKKKRTATKISSNAKRVNTLSRMERYTVASGSGASDMVLASRLGQTAHATKVNGRTIRRMVEVSSIMSMEMCLMESGAAIRLTASAPISMSMAQSMRVIGSMICRMERERRRGKTAQSMKECTVRDTSMDRADISGVMEACTWVSG